MNDRNGEPRMREKQKRRSASKTSCILRSNLEYAHCLPMHSPCAWTPHGSQARVGVYHPWSATLQMRACSTARDLLTSMRPVTMQALQVPREAVPSVCSWSLCSRALPIPSHRLDNNPHAHANSSSTP